MKIKLLVFGIFTDIFGKSSLELEVPSRINVIELKAFIIKNYPKTAKLSFVVAVDESYAEEDTQILEHQVVALIPPVSGG
ncbi:MAG TPA: MoaD/ThiS family protein [Flavobacteriaceae bacterium]|nr:MoaD/ThiS family protein [Flavobacteriaceae bacterium]